MALEDELEEVQPAKWAGPEGDSAFDIALDPNSREELQEIKQKEKWLELNLVKTNKGY